MAATWVVGAIETVGATVGVGVGALVGPADGVVASDEDAGAVGATVPPGAECDAGAEPEGAAAPVQPETTIVATAAARIKRRMLNPPRLVSRNGLMFNGRAALTACRPG